MTESPRGRSITIVNDDPSRLILVTESVVKRLKGQSNVKEEQVETIPSTPARRPKKESLTAREEELLEIEQYWMKRLREMDDQHTKVNRISTDDLNKTLSEFEHHFGNPTASVPKCHIDIEKILQCYKDNPKQTLLCNKEIQEFSNCLDKLNTRT